MFKAPVLKSQLLSASAGRLQQVLFLLVFAICGPQVWAGALESEIAELTELAQSGNSVRAKELVERITFSGIQDQGLFDAIEAQLRENLPQRGALDVEYNAWLVKALAFSGDISRYGIMDEILYGGKAHRKLKRHAGTAKERLPSYLAWNPIIAKNNEDAADAQALAQVRVRNMLNATDPYLIRAGARHVYHRHSSNAELQQLVADKLQSIYEIDSNDGILVDAMSWMVKALSVSGNSEYRELLDNVATSAGSSKVRSYGKKYRKTL